MLLFVNLLMNGKNYFEIFLIINRNYYRTQFLIKNLLSFNLAVILNAMLTG